MFQYVSCDKGAQFAACLSSLTSDSGYQNAIISVNSHLWVVSADQPTGNNWLTYEMLSNSIIVVFNPITQPSAAMDQIFTISYTYSFRSSDLHISSADQVKASFIKAVAVNITAYNAALKMRGGISGLSCTQIKVSEVVKGIIQPTKPYNLAALFQLSASSVLIGCAILSAAVAAYVTLMRAENAFNAVMSLCSSSKKDETGKKDTDEMEDMVAFSPSEVMISITLSVFAACSNFLQITQYFKTPGQNLGSYMLLARVLVVLYTAYMLQLIFRNDALKQKLAGLHLYKVTLWIVISLVAMVDSTHLRLFPWKATEFAKRSGGYPNLRLFRMGLSCTAMSGLAQLSLSAINGFPDISSIVSFSMSATSFCMTVITIVMKLTAENVHLHDQESQEEGEALRALEEKVALLTRENQMLRAHGSGHAIEMAVINSNPMHRGSAVSSRVNPAAQVNNQEFLVMRAQIDALTLKLGDRIPRASVSSLPRASLVQAPITLADFDSMETRLDALAAMHGVTAAALPPQNASAVFTAIDFYDMQDKLDALCSVETQPCTSRVSITQMLGSSQVSHDALLHTKRL